MKNGPGSRGPGRVAGLVALAAVLGMAAPGCMPGVGLASGPRVSQSWKGSIAMAAPLTLVIDDPIGDVNVAGDATEGVRVEAVKKAADRKVLDAITIKLEGKDGRATLSVKGPKRGNWSVDLVVHVPAETGLEDEQGVGNLTAEGLAGKFRAKVGVGNIEGKKLTVRENSSFEGGTGNVTVEAAAIDGERSLSARSGVGNVEVALPTGLGYQLDAKTGVGHVDLGGVALEGGSARKGVVGAEIHGRTRGAEPSGRKVTLESGTGDVTLKTR